MEYSALVRELYALRDEKFAEFQEKIVNPRAQKIVGVRTPVLRRLVKKYRAAWREFLTFPDEYYEVTFLKLNAAALLPFEALLPCLDECVNAIENWALCDTFKPACIAKHREEFVPYIKKYLAGGEFSQRFALVTLLSFYMEEKYLPLIFGSLQESDTAPYYTHMGAAWLLAEVLVKFYDRGVAFLRENRLDKRTHNKAIQKARESFRLTKGEKDALLSLKRK